MNNKKPKSEDILALARERYQAGVDGDKDNRERDQYDREFYKGGDYQWDFETLQNRKDRPRVTINRLPQFVKQITGELRQNKPAIRVLPVDDKTDPEIAEVFGAIIRHIESRSDAHRVYAKAGEQAVIGGIGWFRILTDYLSDTSFEQEISVKSIRNPMSVVCDPNAIELTKHDMMWCIISEMMTLEAFRAEYPNASETGFDVSDHDSNPYGSHMDNWREGNFIRVAEYWTKEPYERELLLLSDGSTRYADDTTQEDEQFLIEAQIEVVDRRKVTAYKIKWRKITGVEVLDEGEWLGQYIPIIPCVGEEIEVGDVIFRHGLIYNARDSQKSYNFARTAMLEHVASQPKAPYLATTKMVENHRETWERVGVDNPPVLLYDPDPNAPGARPERVSPPTFAAAWYQEAQTADNDMKATTGIYDASLGQSGNETSGVAIRARDSQGETANYMYIDNVTAAIHQAGKILIDLIPKIYSDERVIRVMGEDSAIEGYASINKQLPGGVVFNDISVGQFDLQVSTGPAFATKRQEAAEKMMELIRAVPQIGQVGADMIVKALDMPNGDKLADRLALTLLPPGIDAEIDAKRQALQPQQQPDPMQQQLAQMALAEKAAEIKETESKSTLNNAKAASEASSIQAMVEQAVLQQMQQLGFQAGYADEQ